MRRDTKTVWYGDDDRELLVQKKTGSWYIPLSDVDEKLLRELDEAIRDALGDPLVNAIEHARNGKAKP